MLDKEWHNHSQIIPDKINNYPTPPPSNSILIGITPSSTDINHPLFLSALVLNCQSIVAKKESFINLMMFIILMYFWLWILVKSCIVSSKVFPSGYTIYRKDRVDGYSGVFIVCHNFLISNELTFTDSSSELVACKIQLADGSSLIACAIYCPPSSNESYLEDLSSQLSQIHSDHPNSVLWIGGHINLPDINWSNTSVSGHSHLLKFNHILLDFLLDNTYT